jgi:hypothetical protein
MQTVTAPAADARCPSEETCSSCFYWVNKIGCCRHGSPTFRKNEPVSDCSMYRPDTYITFSGKRGEGVRHTVF